MKRALAVLRYHACGIGIFALAIIGASLVTVSIIHFAGRLLETWP